MWKKEEQNVDQLHGIRPDRSFDCETVTNSIHKNGAVKRKYFDHRK